MKILLDTHTFLWLVWGKNLSEVARSTFINPENDIYFSAASYWEISIKVSLGKLDVGSNWIERFDNEIAINSIRWLPITKEHCQRLLQLPKIHNDPFDRLLVAQAQVEALTLLTADTNIQQYPISAIW